MHSERCLCSPLAPEETHLAVNSAAEAGEAVQCNPTEASSSITKGRQEPAGLTEDFYLDSVRPTTRRTDRGGKVISFAGLLLGQTALQAMRQVSPLATCRQSRPLMNPLARPIIRLSLPPGGANPGSQGRGDVAFGSSAPDRAMLQDRDANSTNESKIPQVPLLSWVTDSGLGPATSKFTALLVD
jgi:hypothetical protein